MGDGDGHVTCDSHVARRASGLVDGSQSSALRGNDVQELSVLPAWQKGGQLIELQDSCTVSLHTEPW